MARYSEEASTSSGSYSGGGAIRPPTPQAPAGHAPLTSGQLGAAQRLAELQGQTWQDYVPSGPSGSESAGISPQAWSDMQVQHMINAPEGTYNGSQIQAAIDAANQTYQSGGAQALGQQNYNQQLNYVNDSIAWWEANPHGHDMGTIGSFMQNVFPYIVGGFMAAGAGAAAGLFGEAAGAGAAAGGAGAGEAALGAAAGLDGAAAVGAGVGAGGAAAGGAGAGAGLGSMIGVAGGPMAVVGVGAPAAGAGIGLGGAALGGAAAVGLGSMVGGGDIPRVEVPGQRPPPEPTGGNIPIPPLPYLPPGSVQPGPASDPIGTINLPNLPIPPLPYLPPGSVQPGSGTTPPGTTPPGSGWPSLGDIIGGLGPILGGINDYQNSQEDRDWWKGQLDTLMGMYKPGTPEATLMENKMNAKDAASGRNSQYGVRAVDLASNLADKRAGIMTSGGYQNMANAYRNRSSQDLNGLFGALGNTQTQNLIGAGLNGLSGLFGGTAPTR